MKSTHYFKFRKFGGGGGGGGHVFANFSSVIVPTFLSNHKKNGYHYHMD